MPANIADCRIFLKFDEAGNRIDTLIEDHNLKITPKKPIIEYEQGEEIFLTIPAHGDVNDNAEAVSVPETKIPTGKYEQIEKIVGYEPEHFEPLVDSFIEVSYEEYLLVSGNSPDGKEYIRNMETGEYIEKPPYIPTAEEKLAALDAEFEPLFKAINDQIVLAAVENDEPLKSELQAEKEALLIEYANKRGEL